MLDLIEDGEGGELVVDRGPGTARYQRRNRAGDVTRVVTALSIGEGSGVLSSDLWGAVRSWSRLDAAREPTASFVLHADGPLYPTAGPAVADRLRRFAEGCATAEDVRVVRMVGLPAESPLLRSVRLRCSAGPHIAVVDDACWRLEQLLLGTGRDAGAAIARLLCSCSEVPHCGGTIGRDEAAEVAGVDLTGLDQASDWEGGPGPLPVTVGWREAAVSGLGVAIRRQLQASSSRPVSAAAARRILGSHALVLRLTGPGLATGAASWLAEELAMLRAANPALRVVTVDPDANGESP
ncbi:MAG TPA: hypothetical protein VHA57_08240 [Actinomycetota bacterium]|nr:hypothetical protein [Actinomycetota bacterium]